MKVSPIAAGAAASINTNEGRTATPEKLELAKRIAAGETPIRVSESDTPIDPQAEKAQRSIRKIKMKTNLSTDRFKDPVEEVVVADGAKTDATEEVEGSASDETKPISPQFAALAKERRAVQVERAQVAAERAELEKLKNADMSDFISKADIKAKPLRILQENGVTYDQLTEAILSEQDGVNPEMQALKEKVKALEEGITKTFTDRDQQAEQQVLGEMRKEAVMLVKQGNDFEMVRETRSVPDVMKLIERTYKETGEVLEVQEALKLVEDELINESLKIANINKVKNRILPPQTEETPKFNGIRTLTNRDTAPVGLSRRERAIMAMNGTLRKG